MTEQSLPSPSGLGQDLLTPTPYWETSYQPNKSCYITKSPHLFASFTVIGIKKRVLKSLYRRSLLSVEGCGLHGLAPGLATWLAHPFHSVLSVTPERYSVGPGHWYCSVEECPFVGSRRLIPGTTTPRTTTLGTTTPRATTLWDDFQPTFRLGNSCSRLIHTAAALATQFEFPNKKRAG